jgi:hypothetical protein
MFKLKHLKQKKVIFIISLFFITTVFLFIPQQAKAVGDAIAGGIASILGIVILPIVSLFGKLAGVMIRLLIRVAQYNDFINSPAVSKGWIIIRDIFNIFFVVILLVIAFATVLKIDRYSYKKMLGGFLLAAVLVNFSKLICGIIIDVAQILMLTFVNAFKTVGEGNLADMLGLRQLLSLSPDATATNMGIQKLGALLLGLIFATIALVVITIITLVFVFRIVMLWFLVLLSPLAFVAQVLPNLQRYASQWWQKFGSQVVVGPVLAFFLWLSLAMVQEGQILNMNVSETGSRAIEGMEEIMATPGEAGQPQFILNFIIGIAMLIGSLMVAQQMGVAGGQMAGKAAGKIQGVMKGAAKMPLKGASRGVKRGVKELEARTHIPLTKSRFQEISAERKRQIKKKQDDRWEGKIGTRGLASLPMGTKAWGEIQGLKGRAKLVGRVAKGIVGRDNKLREDAEDKGDDVKKIEQDINSKTSTQKNKEEIDNKISETEKREAKIFDDEKGLSKNQLTLSSVPDFLQNLEVKISQLKESDKDEDIENLINLELLKNDVVGAQEKAKAEGKNSISFDEMYSPQDINKQRLTSEGQQWVKQKKEKIKNEKDELLEQKQKIEFTSQDQKEISNGFKNIAGEISQLKVSDSVKQSLSKEIKELIKEIGDVPLAELNQEKRDKLGEKAWNVRQQFKNLVKNKDIGEEKGQEIIKRTEDLRGQTIKGSISPENLKKKQEQKKSLEEEIRALNEKAEIIRPTKITNTEREAMHRQEVEAMKNIDPESGTDELLDIYHQSQKKGDKSLAKACLRILNKNGNIAKVLDDFDLEQNSKGLGELGKKISEQLDISQQEAFLFVNDLQAENKIKGRNRYAAGVKRDKLTGTYQPTTEDEQEKIITVLSEKRNRNKFPETATSQDLFQMQKDTETGEYVPVKGRDEQGNIIKGADSVAMGIIKDDLQIFWKKINEGKISLDIEKGLSHQSVINDLKNELKKVSPDSAEYTYFENIINHLEKVNSKHW